MENGKMEKYIHLNNTHKCHMISMDGIKKKFFSILFKKVIIYLCINISIVGYHLG